MENLAISIMVILAATSAIFGAATLLLGKEVRNIRGQLWSQEAQQHLEEQEALRALKAAHEKIKWLERAQEMQRPKEKTANSQGLRSLNKVKQSLFKPESPLTGAFCVFKQLNNKKGKRLDRKEQKAKKVRS